MNDVVLAAVTSGFRDLLVARGEDPDDVALRTLVPVSVRDETGRRRLRQPGARRSSSTCPCTSPIHSNGWPPSTRRWTDLKQSHEAEAGEALTTLAGAVPPALMAQATRLGVAAGVAASRSGP